MGKIGYKRRNNMPYKKNKRIEKLKAADEIKIMTFRETLIEKIKSGEITLPDNIWKKEKK